MNFWTTLVDRWSSRPRKDSWRLRLWPRRPVLEILEERWLPSSSPSKVLLDAYGHIPLSFEANQGQTDPQVQFLAHGNGYAVSLTASEATFRLKQPSMAVSGTAGQVVRLLFIGANLGARPIGLDPLIEGNAGVAQNQAGINRYAKIEYQDVYQGINLVYYDHNGALEYDFVVASGADPGAIALRFQGAQGMHIDAAGNLVVPTPAGDLVETAPVLYQVSDGVRQTVAGVG